MASQGFFYTPSWLVASANGTAGSSNTTTTTSTSHTESNSAPAEPSSSLPEDSRLLSFSSSSDDTDSTDSNGLKNAKKHHWTPEEDENLRLLVQKYGPRDWGKIAMHLNNRNGKQCHQRWNYFLNPTVRRGDWTQEEDRAIIYHQRMVGNKWAKIASYLPGRTGHAVKNRFHQIANHMRRRRCPPNPVAPAENTKMWPQPLNGVHEPSSYAWQAVSQDCEGVPPPPPGYQYVSVPTMPMSQETASSQSTAAYLQAVKPSQMSMQQTLLAPAQGQYYQTPEEIFAYQWAATQPQAAMQAAYGSPHTYVALLPEFDMMAAQQQQQQQSHASAGAPKWK